MGRRYMAILFACPDWRWHLLCCYRYPVCRIESKSDGPVSSSIPSGMYQCCVRGHGFPGADHTKRQQHQPSVSMAPQSDTQVKQSSRTRRLDTRLMYHVSWWHSFVARMPT